MAWKDNIEDWTTMKFTESQIAAQNGDLCNSMERNINQKCQGCLQDLKQNLRDEEKTKEKKTKLQI